VERLETARQAVEGLIKGCAACAGVTALEAVDGSMRALVVPSVGWRMRRERLERRVTSLAKDGGSKRRATPCSYDLVERERAALAGWRWNRHVIAGSGERHNNQMQRTSAAQATNARR